MRALTVEPLAEDSLALSDMPEPATGPQDLLVEALAIGVCGTDREIAAGEYGLAPPGEKRLIIGHESLGRVLESPSSSAFAAGDLVVGVVRRPDPVPCGACLRGQFDMCRNGKYTERGIKELHGYASDRWRVETDYAVKLDVRLAEVGMLLEPTSVVAKAWDQINKVGSRSWFQPRTVLVTGAGPIGMLAAMIGVQRGLDVHVLDQVTTGPKPDLVSDLGATYHHTGIDDVADKITPDIVIEATGVGQLIFGAARRTATYGIACLTGVSPTGHPMSVEAGTLNRDLVLENDVIIGSVNANLDHYTDAAAALARADLTWLGRLITRRIPLQDFDSAFETQTDDIKVVLTFEKNPT